jgi:ribosomal protein S18 acetylase RimI-like enzyme
MRQQPFASPEEALAHFGVKGMKWGVRKEKGSTPELKGLLEKPLVVKTKNGDELTLTPDPPSKLVKVMAKFSDKHARSYNESAFVTIKDKHGKDVGQGQMWLKGPKGKPKDELYLNWVDIHQSERGKGYATAVLHSAEEHARARGLKKLSLEVPGISPDARHIYEKMGFKATDQGSVKKDPVWGGLTHMEKHLD